MTSVSQESGKLSPLKRAFLKLEELQAKLDASERAKREPIAVIGIGCRFPGGADGPQAFWRLLRDGVDAVGEIPPTRWDVEAYYDPNPEVPGKTICKWGAFLNDVDEFDAQFFGISPREANSLDPQQRMLLEVTWEALENAGQPGDRLVGSRTGVFVAMCKMDYAQLLMKAEDPRLLDAYYATGNAYSTASGRLSYFLGLQGPSITLDTACSSSLVAVHLACQSLRTRESDLTLVGAANLILSPENTILFSQSSMLAADGRCKTFDADADGFVQGEGCGVVVLKRLSDALAANDRILALIRGSALNQDGPSSGLTAPNGPSQEAVILEALENAGLEPSQISYVEAHGTGTSLGDPIEVQALGRVLCQGRSKERPLLIGTVKTNLGHLEGAAGIAGLIKVVLALQHKEIPPSLHFRNPNPYVSWDRLPIEVATERIPWVAVNGPRIAGVSAFGFSGTNAHVLVEEAPEPRFSEPGLDRPLHLFCLSVKGESALREMVGRYEGYLGSGGEDRLADICYSANAGRAQLSNRLAVVAGNTSELHQKLAEFSSGLTPAGVQFGRTEIGEEPKLAMLFTGQGSQYVGMARQLYDTQPTFRKTLDACDELLRPHLHRPLRSLLYSESVTPSLLERTEYTQPVLFAVEFSLATLWRAWGIEPSVVMGHSVGELVAACIAGVFTLEDGLKLIAARGRLIQTLPDEGMMAAVFAPEERVATTLQPFEGSVSIAGVNGPENTVISGKRDHVHQILKKLESQGIGSKRLAVSHAFHSPLMEPILDDFAQVASEVRFAEPRIGIVSNASGRIESGKFYSSPNYWRRHVRQTVKFSAGIRTLHDKAYTLFLEVGPHPTLSAMGSRCLPEKVAVWLPSLRKGRDEWQQMLSSLSALYVHGLDVDWARFDADYPRRRLALPTYPFQRKRYWHDLALQRSLKVLKPAGTVSPQGTSHPLLGRRLRLPIIHDTVFESRLDVGTTSYIGEHKVHGMAVLPAAAYLEMISSAAAEVFGSGAHTIEDMDIREALVFSEDNERTIQLVLSPEERECLAFRIISFGSAATPGQTDWRLHATGKIRGAGLARGRASEAGKEVSLDEIRARCREEVPVTEYYRHLRERGLEFGPGFHGIAQLWRGSDEALGRICLPDVLQAEVERYGIHPAFLDACLQIAGAIMADDRDEFASDEIYMPIGLDLFRMRARPGTQLWSHVVRRWKEGTGEETRSLDFLVTDPAGAAVAEIQGLQVKRVAPEILRAAARTRLQEWLYEVAWEPKPLEHKTTEDIAAAHFTATARIAEDLEQGLRRLSVEHNLAIYNELLPELDSLSLAFVLQGLQEMGWKTGAGQRFSTDLLAGQLGVVSQHRRLFARLLEILEEEGILRRVDGGWEALRGQGPADPTALALSLESKCPAHTAELTLLKRGGQCLAEALRGRCDPLSVLFPGGSFAIAEKLYEESAPAKVYNGLARKTISAIRESIPEDQGIRVLEIGAGTGGTTSFIIDEFPAERTNYLFTDISQMFLSRAREKFSRYPFISYHILDIEEDPEAQGFIPGSFDLIVAANVIHATKDIRQSLRHLKQLLVPEGMLLLVEGTSPQRWIDLTFGMTEGWWRFIDHDLRPSYPLLSASKWIALLEEMGFSEVKAVPGGEQTSRGLSQNAILLARAPHSAMRGADAPSPDKPPGSWVILTDHSGVGASLSELLESRGENCVLVSPATSYESIDTKHYSLDPTKPDDFRRFFHDTFSNHGLLCRGIAHLWSIDGTIDENDSSTNLAETQKLGSCSLLHLVQALTETQELDFSRLWVVTRGAQPVRADAESVAVTQAPIWGLCRTMAFELPEIRCARVDLDPSAVSDNSQLLFEEIWFGDEEDQVAFRDNVRYVARLARKALDLSRVPRSPRESIHASVQLVLATPGSPEGLELRPMTRRAPGHGEIEIRVRATGLNFRDVLNVLGMRQDPEPLGGECSGTVVAVGEGVREYEIGDEVVAVTEGGFGTFVTAKVDLVVKKPKHMSFEEAATVPLAFLTASYALHSMGQISAGERVLIHAAAGGVGMAAVQVAQRAGAVILATAGNPKKREFLRSLGVRHVMDSRSLDFADEVMKLTGDQGVDIVLNSLTGEFISKGLSILRENGRFLEVGKKEIWSAEQVAKVNDKIKYLPVDLAERIRRDPAAIRPLLLELMRAMENGSLKPLPRKVFPLRDAANAFRYMAQARHIGKVVVSQAAHMETPQAQRDDRPSGLALDSPSSLSLASDATYLVTGGLSGLGLLVARWLTERGARHLALMGRREPSDSGRSAIQEMEKRGADVLVAQGDVSHGDDIAGIIAQIRKTMPPLRGVIHCAGVLDDGILLQQTWDRFDKVLAPKVYGTWNIHLLTRDIPLDFFVLFSSVSSVFGSPAQANHAAANAFLDAMAHYRRAQGMPAMSINWGAWSETGAAARHDVGERIAVRGIHTFSPQEGLQILDLLFEGPTTQIAVLPIDWSTFLEQFPATRRPVYFARLGNEIQVQRKHVATFGADGDLLTELEGAVPSKREKILLDHVEKLAVKVLGLDSSQVINEREPLTALGLDSLMAVELRNLLATSLRLQRPLPATLVFDYPTTLAIAGYLARTLFALGETQESDASMEGKVPDSRDILDNIEQLSDEEVDRLVADRMKRGN
jgi:acyl transferase domain-containing protein/NADPH:quinone reductase-like Zn-dependent oxidoreductase/SAM-dependent methyltransferase